VDSLDGLDRLLEVEKRASDLMRLAESEASLVIGRAQDETKKVEKKALVDARARFEREAADVESKSETALKDELDAYRAGLSALPRDEESFKRLCALILLSGT